MPLYSQELIIDGNIYLYVGDVEIGPATADITTLEFIEPLQTRIDREKEQEEI